MAACYPPHVSWAQRFWVDFFKGRAGVTKFVVGVSGGQGGGGGCQQPPGVFGSPGAAVVLLVLRQQQHPTLSLRHATQHCWLDVSLSACIPHLRIRWGSMLPRATWDHSMTASLTHRPHCVTGVMRTCQGYQWELNPTGCHCNGWCWCCCISVSMHAFKACVDRTTGVEDAGCLTELTQCLVCVSTQVRQWQDLWGFPVRILAPTRPIVWGCPLKCGNG